jgi:hypothetical protein
MADNRAATPIDPDNASRVTAAHRYIPSVRGGCLSLSSLHGWARRGLLAFEERLVGRTWQRFARGSETLRLLETEVVEADAPLPLTPAERGRAVEEAMRRLRARGCHCRPSRPPTAAARPGRSAPPIDRRG